MAALESVEIRGAENADRHPVALLFAKVAEERDGIAAEPPIDVEQHAARLDLEGTFVAIAAAEVVGRITVIESAFGFGEIAMYVAREWRGRGVGSALLAAAIEWASARGLHKLTLSVFPRNDAAIALYRSSVLPMRGCTRVTSGAQTASFGTCSTWGCRSDGQRGGWRTWREGAARTFRFSGRLRDSSSRRSCAMRTSGAWLR